MAKAEALGPEHIALVGGTLWVANYLVAKGWGYPFLYCWLSPAATAFYMAWATLALYVLALYILFQLLARSVFRAIIGALIGMCIIELPRLCDYLFRLGASCG